MALLELRDVHTYYGNIHALKGVSMTVDAGEIVTLIGSNGAGKSTTLKTISGLLRPRHGEIWFDGKRVDGTTPHEIVGLGISQAPEIVYRHFPRLKERLGQNGGTLSGGEQQMLAIGRALMARPKLILLDEPSMGLAPILVEQIFEIVKDINAAGTTVLLVEQNALMALGLAQRGYILQTGEIVLQDVAEKLIVNPEVQKAYLGG
jgi:branched-chain amino acid transport system ATP-binding protein